MLLDLRPAGESVQAGVTSCAPASEKREMAKSARG